MSTVFCAHLSSGAQSRQPDVYHTTGRENTLYALARRTVECAACRSHVDGKPSPAHLPNLSATSKYTPPVGPTVNFRKPLPNRAHSARPILAKAKGVNAASVASPVRAHSSHAERPGPQSRRCLICADFVRSRLASRTAHKQGRNQIGSMPPVFQFVQTAIASLCKPHNAHVEDSGQRCREG